MEPWYVCYKCGSSLDPGERCDCEDRELAAYCTLCGQPLYAESYLCDQDEAYEINEIILCEDCVHKYVRKECKVKL